MFDTLLKDEQTLTQVDYPDIDEFTESEKLKKEKEIVGVYVSGHPLDKYMKQFSQYTFKSTMIKKQDETADGEEMPSDEEDEESDIYDGMQVTFGGIITDIKKMFTKKDSREMCILKVEDLYGEVDCFVFPNNYKNLKPEIELDKVAIFNGKISKKDDMTSSIILESISGVETKQEQTKVEDKEEKKKILWLKFDNTDQELKDKIIKILENYSGETECRILCSSQNKVFRFERTVEVNNLLLYELETILPENNIKFV